MDGSLERQGDTDRGDKQACLQERMDRSPFWFTPLQGTLSAVFSRVF